MTRTSVASRDEVGKAALNHPLSPFSLLRRIHVATMSK